MALQQTLLHWVRTPNADVFNSPTFESFSLGSVSANQANSTVQQSVLFGTLFKIRKVAVAYTAVAATTGTHSFNLVVGTGSYTASNIAGNDNSYSSGTNLPTSSVTPTNVQSIGATTIYKYGGTTGAGTSVAVAGAGYPTNVALSGAAVFSADITFQPSSGLAQQTGVQANTTYAPGWISCTTTGGYGIFVPPNYDAVYPMLLPMTLRVTTPASTGSITNLNVMIVAVPITPLAYPGSVNFVTPGLDW